MNNFLTSLNLPPQHPYPIWDCVVMWQRPVATMSLGVWETWLSNSNSCFQQPNLSSPVQYDLAPKQIIKFSLVFFMHHLYMKQEI